MLFNHVVHLEAWKAYKAKCKVQGRVILDNVVHWEPGGTIRPMHGIGSSSTRPCYLLEFSFGVWELIGLSSARPCGMSMV